MSFHLPGFPGQSSTWIGHGIVAAVIVALAHAWTHDPAKLFALAVVTAIGFRLKEWNDTRKHNRDGHSPLQVMDELRTTIVGDGHADMTGPYTVAVYAGASWLFAWIAQLIQGGP